MVTLSKLSTGTVLVKMLVFIMSDCGLNMLLMNSRTSTGLKDLLYTSNFPYSIIFKSSTLLTRQRSRFSCAIIKVRS